MDILDLFLMNDGPSIQNLDFIRQLIAQVRGEAPAVDMARLRMPLSGNLGMNAQSGTGGGER